MKSIFVKYLAVLALALVSAGLAFGAESKRGFYEGEIAGGGKIVFFVQGNHAICCGSMRMFSISSVHIPSDPGGG